MVFHSIYYTRTEIEDYHWIQKPDYIGSEAEIYLRPLFRIAEKTDNTEYLLKKGKRNLFIFQEKDYILLCYIYLTEKRDSYGRQIYAVEGMSCNPYTKDSALILDFLMVLIHMLLNPRNLSGMRVFSKDGTKLGKQINYNPEQLMDASEIFDLDNDLENWGYGRIITLLYQDLKVKGFSKSSILATEKRSFYMMDSAEYYNLFEVQNTFAESEEVFYETSDEYDSCKLRFYLEQTQTDETSKYTLNAMLTSDNAILGWYRNISLKSEKNLQEKDGLGEGIPIFAIYNHFYKCEKVLKKLGMEIEGGEQILIGERIKVTDYSQTKLDVTGYGEVSSFKWENLEKWNNPDKDFTSQPEKAIMDWYRVSLRYSNYYTEDGKDTLYILNLHEGLYIFQFIRSIMKNVAAEGVVIRGDEHRKAGREFFSIIEKCKSLKLSLLSVNDKFKEQLYMYVEDMRFKSITSAVISTTIPKNCRQNVNIRYYCTDVPKSNIDLDCFMKTETELLDWKINPSMCQNMVLRAERKAVFIGDVMWNLIGRIPVLDYRKKTEDDDFVFTISNEKMECIDEKGTFEFISFDREFKRLVNKNHYDDLYVCSYCGQRKIVFKPSHENSKYWKAVCQKCSRIQYGVKIRTSFFDFR